MIYCFDIDGTICDTMDGDYYNSIPKKDVIKKIQRLYENGDTIIFMTARGATSGKDWTDWTIKQLSLWNLKYHELLMNIKPHADFFIDDKGINIKDFMKE